MKAYQKPAIQIVPIRHTSTICSASDPVTSVNSNETGITYGGGDNGAARVREHSAWDEEW